MRPQLYKRSRQPFRVRVFWPDNTKNLREIKSVVDFEIAVLDMQKRPMVYTDSYILRFHVEKVFITKFPSLFNDAYYEIDNLNWMIENKGAEISETLNPLLQYQQRYLLSAVHH